MTTTAPESGSEEVQDLQHAISDSLSDLSQADQAPKEVSLTAPFAPGEVDWTSAAWMARVQSVRGWLRLPSELDSTSPAAFVASLSNALRAVDVHESDNLSSDRLSVAKLARLQERAARALELQRQYFEDLDDNSESSVADQRWRAAWDGSEEDPDLAAAGPVSASATTWSIIEFANRARLRKLNLSPSYQRGDVWPTPDAQILIESILRGIPLPSVIILKPESSATGVFEVVDGKQRLTAILRFMGQHPHALKTVQEAAKEHPTYQLDTLFEKDYRKFRLAWKNATGQQLTDKIEREKYFPFRLRSGGDNSLRDSLTEFQGRYYSEIRNSEVAISEGKVAVWEVFESASSDYKIPLIQYTKATRRQVHEVFKLYNKQGKQLNAEEIRNAMYHELSLMRGLLVAAGDSSDPASVAPFLYNQSTGVAKEQVVADLGQSLEDYNFGKTRYKRTKVLSWLAALLLLESRQQGGNPSRRSTAGQIDELLRTVEKDRFHALREEDRLTDLLFLIGSAVEVHSAVPDAWLTLRGGSAGRWEEMPLVGTLLGVTQALLLKDEASVIDTLDDSAGELRDAGRANLFRRPKSIQTATQWGYISRLALGVAERLGASPEDAHNEADGRFGTSGIATLVEVADMHESG